MLILIREFQSPDEEMKKIVLKVGPSEVCILSDTPIGDVDNSMSHGLFNIFACLLFSQVVKQCCATDGVEADYIRQEILPDYFRHFWNHRMALDRRNYKQVMFLATTQCSDVRTSIQRIFITVLANKF